MNRQFSVNEKPSKFHIYILYFNFKRRVYTLDATVKIYLLSLSMRRMELKKCSLVCSWIKNPENIKKKHFIAQILYKIV